MFIVNIEERSQIQKGRIVVFKDDSEKRIYPDQLSQYEAEGWSKGRSPEHRRKLSESHCGKEPWNKGTKGVMKPSSTSFSKGH